MIGGLPSTVFVSLLFIGITQTPAAASETTTLMPLAQGIMEYSLSPTCFMSSGGLRVAF